MRRISPLSSFIVPAVLASVCVFACANIWLGHGIINTRAGGDSPFLLIRTYELATNLRTGVFPARWMADAAFGLGYPFFNFYAALPYYFAAGLNLLGADLLTAIKLVQTVGMFAAAGAMFLFARSMLPVWGATLAAAAYTLAPFHMVNVFVRGDSLSEFWAFVWYPLILWSLARLTADAERLPSFVTVLPAFIGLSLSLAALVLTHNVSAMIFAPFIVIYALAVLIRRARRSARRSENFAVAFVRLALPPALAALLALALSAWFWLPALGDAPAVQLGDQTTGYFNYANHFRGFRGVNLVQPSLVFDYGVDESLGVFAMGSLQAALIVAGAVVWFSANRRARQSNFCLALMAALFLLSTLMITPLSAAVWERAPLLPLAQFPWRFLSVQAVFASVLAGGIGKLEIGHMRLPAFSLPCLAILALLGVALARLPNERLNIRAEDVTPRTVQLYEWYSGNIGTTIRAEYLPATARPRPLTGPDLLHSPHQVLIAQDSVATDAISSELLIRTPVRQIWRVVAKQASLITLPVLHTPAWHAWLDGVPVNTSAYVGSGWVALQTPPGEHRIELQWQETPLGRAGAWIAAAGLLVLITLVILAFARATSFHGRAVGVVAVAAVAGVLCIGAIAALANALQSPSEAPALQTLDFERRPFPHRDSVHFRSADGVTFELIGASVEPEALRAGEAFTLSLRWRDDRAPARIIMTQELPMGGEFAPLFRHARLQTTGDPRTSQHRVLPDALPGPLLLKLSATDAAGQVLAPYMPDGASLRTQIAGKPASAITLLGPPIVATEAVAQPRVGDLIVFDNGIALHDMDWFFSSAHEVCLRPVWRRARANVNRADSLHVSLRLFGSDGRLIAQADGQPQAGLAPTWSWPDGALISDGRCVPADAKNVLRPNEPYAVQIVWYRLADLYATGEGTLRGVHGTNLNELNTPRP